jgi:hypothetical protein
VSGLADEVRAGLEREARMREQLRVFEAREEVDESLERLAGFYAAVEEAAGSLRVRERPDEPLLDVVRRLASAARCAGVALAAEDQPPPAANGERAVWEVVIEDVLREHGWREGTPLLGLPERPVQRDLPGVVVADMRARDGIGLLRYGVRLQPRNGRDALSDAYQEALDLAVYLRQGVLEGADVGHQYGVALGVVFALRWHILTRDAGSPAQRREPA